jgi:hypothetical protein
MCKLQKIFVTLILITVTALPLQSCDKRKPDTVITEKKDSTGNTIKTRFRTPEGFVRVTPEKNSFAEYLQNLPLKPEGTVALNFDGTEKQPNDVYAAVVNIDVGDKDLQQCADAVMRLRAEYLFAQGKFDDIKFNFTNGFTAEYSKWRQGYRISVSGNKVSWIKKSDESSSYSDFRKYLDVVFTYAGTLSLEKELTPVDINEIEIGSVFIKGGSPGHAVIVVDLAENKATGEKVFLIAQSYMPAQDIQILKNPIDKSLSPWYSSKLDNILETPEWTFKKTHLRKF